MRGGKSLATDKGRGKGESQFHSNQIQNNQIGFLIQMVNGIAKYPNDCKYFSVINAFLMAGNLPVVRTNDLAQYVHEKVMSANYALAYIDLIKDVFGIKAQCFEIKAGLTQAQLIKTIGSNPAMLVYSQKDFWGSNKLQGTHGVGFYNGLFTEPYRGKVGNFDAIRGTYSRSSIENYTGGFYFIW